MPSMRSTTEELTPSIMETIQTIGQVLEEVSMDSLKACESLGQVGFNGVEGLRDASMNLTEAAMKLEMGSSGLRRDLESMEARQEVVAGCYDAAKFMKQLISQCTV
ncbi:hypothetical protein HDU76_005581 [Blyttiomyces sp. JEL0837]|nr:hypothetical protein HDU76_005581 [Blyttiomyces sp. JEL0837]